MADLAAISEKLQKGRRDEVAEMVKAAVEEGVPVKQILDEALIAGMAVVGEQFQKNEIYVPEMLIAARAMNKALEILTPHMVKAGIEPIGKVIIGTAKGDLHDIGKNLVGMMYKGAGFEVIDLGIDVSAEKFVEKAKETGTKLIGVSALLTTTMPQMKGVVEAKNEAGLDCKIIIGGAPVTQAYADEIGADGYAPDAASAVTVGKKVLGLA